MTAPGDGASGELEELEELDDVDLIEDAGAPSEGARAPAARPPPTPAAPPPLPPRATPPPRPPVAPPASPTPPSGPAEAASAAVADESPIDVTVGESLEQLPPAPPIEEQVEVPTVIDRALDVVRAGDHAARAAQVEEDLAHAMADKRRAGLLAYELGELSERYLDDEAAAVKCYDRALRADPTLRPNLWAIRRLIVRRGLWPKLVKLLDAEVRIAQTDDERADLLVEKGVIIEDHTGDVVAARGCYEQAVALDPASVPALLALEKVALTAGDEELLADVWRNLADATHNPGRKLAYLLDLIRLYGRTGADSERLALARQVLVECVGLAPEAGATERVACERERLAELSGDANEMLGALDARIANVRAAYGPQGPAPAPGAPRAAGAPLDRADELRLQIVALRRRQARIARDQAKDPERAWGYLEQALALAGGEPLILADLADLAERLGKYAELAELCQGWESLEGDPSRSVMLSLRRAEALLRGGQREQAEEVLSKLSASAPGFLPITALRERNALGEGDLAALLATYREAGEAAQLGTAFGPGTPERPDPSGAAAAYVMAGDLSASYVGNPAGARELYGKALEVVPGYPPAVEALALLLERTGALEEAAALLELHSEAGEASARAYTLERLARIYRDLGKQDEVVGALERCLELSPEDQLLRWRLFDVLGDLGRETDQLRIVGDIAARVSDPAQKAAVLTSAARLAERSAGGDAAVIERAVGLYRQALELAPESRFARGQLVSALRRAGRWDDIVSERRAEAAQLPDGPAAFRALREAAVLLEERLARPADAAEVYRTLISRAPPETTGRFVRAALARLLADSSGDAAIDDRIGALEALAEDAPDAAAITEHLIDEGVLLEAGGRTADAIYAYRRAGEATPALLHAPLAVAELAAGSGEAATEVEALQSLAQGSADAGITAALWEEVGWTRALALEDYDGAADAFANALAADRGRRGAALGAALVHAKQGDSVAAGESLSEMAETMLGAYAASSLLLRAAAIAEVAGEPGRARQLVARAAATAPDDAGTLVVAAEYMPSSPTEEASDADALIQRAAICAMRAAIASDPGARDEWELDQAEALDAAGQLSEAGQLIAGVLRTRPDDIRALQLLRRVCRRGGDRNGLARASVALARVLGDREGKLALLREAAAIFDGGQHDAAAAVPVYRHILHEDPSAPELSRLLELLREHGDLGGLVEVIGERLNWIDQAEGIAPTVAVPLLFERAVVRSGIGDKRGAARDLAALLERDPRHGDGLRGLAALRMGEGNAADAAALYRRYLELETDSGRRAEVELALSEILAEDMDDIAGAITQIQRVLEESPDDIAVRERLVGMLLKADDASGAVREIREIEKRRKNSAERARDEQRVASILRDKIGDKPGAIAALEQACQLDPLDVDAVRELAELVGEGQRRKVLARAASDVRAAIAAAPGRSALYERLSVLGRWMGDDDSRFYALDALGAVSTPSSEQKQFATKHRAKVHERPLPKKPIDGADWSARVAPPETGGLNAELWRTVAEAASSLVGLGSSTLGFGRGDRQSARSLARDYPAVVQLMTCFGVDCGIYVSASKTGYSRTVSGAPPAVYLGRDIARAADAPTRFALGRALALARENTGTLAEMRPDELAGLLAAAARMAGVRSLPSVLQDALPERELDERARALGKAMSRRDRKNLPLLASRFDELGDPATFRRASLCTGARAGLLACGDLTAALAVLDVGRGGRAIADDPIALDLLAWSVGDDYTALRAMVGAEGGTR